MVGFLNNLLGSKAEMPDPVASNKRKKMYKEFCAVDRLKLNDLIKGTKSGDELTRKMAVLALGDKKEPVVLDPLIKALEDCSIDVQENAIHSLIKLGDFAVQVLINELNQNKNITIDGKANMAKTLGWIKNSSALDVLFKLLKDENEWVRWNAAFGLGKIGDKSSVDPLKKARDKEVYPWVKEYIINVLLEMDK